MLPSFSDLSYFIEVAETKNISRAAERLGISQPSLSSAMKRLEDCLGSQLFIRSRSGVQLTKAGEELVSKGRLLLLNWEQLKSEVNKRENAVAGEYVIGCHPSVASYTLPHFLPQLMSDYPELDIKLAHNLSRKITEGVISHAIDFGIVVNPVKHPDLVIRELCTDEVTFWRAKKASQLQRLNSKSAVLLCDPELTQTQKLLSDFQKKGGQFGRIIHSSSLEVITDLTVRGSGIGLLPSRVALRHKSLGLQKLSDTAPVFKDRICLVYRADTPKTKSRDIIAQAIKSNLQPVKV